MGKTMKTHGVLVRYQGVFDYTAVYTGVINFFLRRNYEYVEGLWKEKKASPLGREISVKMQPFRYITEYLKYEYSIEYKTVHTRSVEIIKDGKKVTMTEANVLFTIGAKMEIDWQGFEKDAPRIGKLYRKYLYDRQLEYEHLPELNIELQQLVDEIKNILGMEMTRFYKS